MNLFNYELLESIAKNISILYVEDDDDLLKEMSLLLRDIFYKVDLANDGEVAFLKYMSSENSYDLIITDIVMPSMNGIELVKNIYNVNSKQKIVVLSAHSEQHHLLELINLGICKFILKPIDYDNFLETIFKLSLEIYNDKILNKNKPITSTKLTDNLIWDINSKQLTYKNKSIKLTKKELLFIELLLKYPGKVFSKEEIINYVWSEIYEIEEQVVNLKNMISRLRKKIPQINIENNYAMGYSINCQINK